MIKTREVDIDPMAESVLRFVAGVVTTIVIAAAVVAIGGIVWWFSA